MTVCPHLLAPVPGGCETVCHPLPAGSSEGEAPASSAPQAAELQFSVCGSLDSCRGLLMEWGAPPAPWGLGQPCSLGGPGNHLSALLAPPPPTGLAQPRPDPMRTRIPGSFLGLLDPRTMDSRTDSPPSPTSAPSRAPTSALGISHCSHPVHEATMGMLWLLLVGRGQ